MPLPSGASKAGRVGSCLRVAFPGGLRPKGGRFAASILGGRLRVLGPCSDVAMQKKGSPHPVLPPWPPLSRLPKFCSLPFLNEFGCLRPRAQKVWRLEGRGPLEDMEVVAPVELAAHQ